MVILYKDPKGEYIFERRQSQGTLNLTAVDDSKNEFGDLEKYCTELEGRLGKYEVSFNTADLVNFTVTLYSLVFKK